ncbi:MAG: mechanosensitive ion channel [Tidjanibacter sp.]|nr:mechanosensitive ion channel [Tidjanibacter sp.]
MILQDIASLLVPEVDTATVAQLSHIDLAAKSAEIVEVVKNNGISGLLEMWLPGLIKLGLKLLAVAVIIFVGRWLIGKVDRFLSRIFERKEVELSLAGFLRNIVKVVLYIIVFLLAIGTLGIKTTSFAAILAAVSLAIGMALSGTLQNFAGGVIILLLRPFKVGDYIQAQGFEGTVKSIQLFNTVLNTGDKKTILLPNGTLSTGSINNFSSETLRRVDIKIGLAYGNDIAEARSVIMALLAKDSRIVKDVEPQVIVTALADSAVNVDVRVWVDKADYWDVLYSLNEQVYNTIMAHPTLEFPFPQVDVHIKNEN